MKFLIALTAIVAMTSVSCLPTKPQDEYTIPTETKEDGTVAKKGIQLHDHGHGHGHGYGHGHHGHNNGWGLDHGHGDNNGWGWNKFISAYGFKIGPQAQAHGRRWTSHEHGHGHGHGHHGHKHHY